MDFTGNKELHHQLKPPPLEIALGMESYGTPQEGIGGVLRAKWEDFVVHELIEKNQPIGEMKIQPYPEGEFYCFVLEKRGLDTTTAIQQLARSLHISNKRLTYTGNKDKNAITIQLASLYGNLPHPLSEIKLGKIRILNAWRCKKPYTLGSHWGNRFSIIIRKINLTKNEINERLDLFKQITQQIRGLPNWYGHQRFGVQRPLTHEIGYFIVQGKIEEAIRIYLTKTYPNEGDDALKARCQLSENWDYKAALRYFPRRLSYERKIIHWLHLNPGDYQGAFRVFPIRLRQIFTHALQSYLFNKILSIRLSLKIPLDKAILGDIVTTLDHRDLPMKIYTPVTRKNLDQVNRALRNQQAILLGPVPGSKTALPNNSWGDRSREMLQEQEIRIQNFQVKKLPELSSTGTYRPLAVEPRNFQFTISKDSLYPNFHQVQVQFDLIKGAYATILLREVMKTSPLNYV